MIIIPIRNNTAAAAANKDKYTTLQQMIYE